MIAIAALVCIVLPSQIIAFHSHPLIRNYGSTHVFGNKIDNILIEGDLTPLSNNILVKVKEVVYIYVFNLHCCDSMFLVDGGSNLRWYFHS
jgi:hypothetical protein